MGQFISYKKCGNCKNKAIYHKIIYSNILPLCTCNYIIMPFKCSKFNSLFYHKCTCNRSVIYDKYMNELLFEYRDILEFLIEIPKDDYRDLLTNEKMSNQFKLNFYACHICINKLQYIL